MKKEGNDYIELINLAENNTADVDNKFDENQQENLFVPNKLNFTEEQRQLIFSQIKEYPYTQSIIDLTKFSLPYVGFSLSLALANMINALLLKATGDEDGLEALLLITSLLYLPMSMGKGFLRPANILISRLTAEKKYKEAGGIFRAGFILSTGMSVPVIAFFLSAKKLLLMFEVDHSITDNVGNYFKIFSIAVPPILWLTLMQDTVLGFGNSLHSSIMGFSFTSLATLIAMPLVLKANFGLDGLGISALISSVISTASSFMYLATNDSYKKYELFNLESNNLKSRTIEFFSIGAPLALQRATENLGPLFMYIGISRWKEAALAAQPAFRITSLFGGTMASLSNLTGTQVSKCMGEVNAASAKGNYLQSLEAAVKGWRIGNSALIIGVSLGTCVVTLSYAIPTQIVNTFISYGDDIYSNGNYANRQLTEELAKDMLEISAIGIVLDTIRNLLMGGLSGRQYVLMPVIISIITMCIIAPLTGYMLAIPDDGDNDFGNPIAFYLTKNFALLIADMIIGYQWLQQNDEKTNEVMESTKNDARLMAMIGFHAGAVDILPGEFEEEHYNSEEKSSDEENFDYEEDYTNKQKV